MHSHTEGTEKPCLLLHGGPGMDGSYFFPYLHPLSKTLRLHGLDLRGSGKSLHLSERPHTMQKIIADIRTFITANNLEDCILLGHSFGGFAALEYALAYPTDISRLIIVASAAHQGFIRDCTKNARRFPKVMMAQREFAESEKTSEHLKQLCLESLPLYFSPGFEQTATDLLNDIQFGGEVYSDIQKHYLSTFDLRKKLETISQQSLVIAAEHDLVLPPKYSEELASLLPNAHYTLMENTAHFPFVEAPEKFCTLIENWMKK